MPPTMTPFPAVRAFAFRPRPTSALRRNGNAVVGIKRRAFADDKNLPEAQQGEAGPNMQQQEHVSEEAAKMSKIMGTGGGPDMEVGTPVQDVCCLSAMREM